MKSAVQRWIVLVPTYPLWRASDAGLVSANQVQSIPVVMPARELHLADVLHSRSRTLNERPGFYQLDLRGPGWYFPTGAIYVSSSGNTLDFGESRLERIREAIPESEPSDFSVGERGGQAGCDVLEDGIAPFAGDDQAVLDGLAGEWVSCSSEYSALVIEESGQITFFDERGDVASVQDLEVVQALGDAAQLRVSDLDWWVAISSTPKKLWIENLAFPGPGEVWTFSAAPDGTVTR